MSAIAIVLGRQILDSRGNPTVEAEVRRLEAELGLLVSDSRDAVAQSRSYMERFDRLLHHLPEDQLRTVFEALGVRIRIDFAANTAGG